MRIRGNYENTRLFFRIISSIVYTATIEESVIPEWFRFFFLFSTNGTRMSEITTSEGEKEEFCAFCKCLAKEKCSVCKIVYYCSREHQKLDWKEHSKNCQPFVLVENSTIGRHYIATRDIKLNEIILRENEALLVTTKPNTAPVCLNCYVPLTQKNAKPCKNCGWPLCNDCTRHGPECHLTMKYRQSKVEILEYSMINQLYDGICVLRAIDLREKSPDRYKKFLILQTVIPTNNMENAHIFKEYLRIDDLNEEEIARIIGIVGLNGYKTYTPKGYNYVAVFDKASYNTHDCRPNCRAETRYDENTGPNIFFQAIRMIPKGQIITISYTEPLNGTMNRREILRDSKYFDCTCERCNDPTEFGTMLSAVKCFEKDCTGYMLPSTFVVPKDTQIPDFICNKCELTTPSTTIDEIMDDVTTQFSELESNNLNQLNRFIEKQSNILHPNHFHIVNAQIKSFYEYSENLNVPDELLKERRNLCKKLAGLHEILATSEYEKRGTILLLECKYMTVLIHSGTSLNRIERRILFEDCQTALEKAHELIRFTNSQDRMHQIELAENRLRSLIWRL